MTDKKEQLDHWETTVTRIVNNLIRLNPELDRDALVNPILAEFRDLLSSYPDGYTLRINTKGTNRFQVMLTLNGLGKVKPTFTVTGK